jgi:hypothetical protein
LGSGIVNKAVTTVMQSISVKTPGILILMFFSLQAIGQQLPDQINDGIVKMDSLKTWQRSIEATHARWLHTLDSLQLSNPADTLLTKQVNELKQSFDSLKQLSQAAGDQVQQKMKQLQQGINRKIKGVESRLNEGLSPLTSNGRSKAISLPKFSLPAVTIPNIPPLGNIDFTLNKPGLPNVGIPPLAVDGSAFPELPQAPNLNVPMVGELGEVSNHIAEGKQVVNGETPALEKIEVLVEENLKDVPAMRSLEEQAALLQKWNTDPQVMKEMAIAKAKEEAINHFAGHEQELKAVMAELSKVKAKSGKLGGVVDLYKKKGQNNLKGITWRQRWLTGVAFQTQIQSVLTFDINPYLYYRITGRFSAGVGWVERIAFDWGNRVFVSEERIFGLRTLFQFNLSEGFALIASPEWVNTRVPASFYNPEVETRLWVLSGFVGMKRDFNLNRQIKGHVQTLYNIYNPKQQSPYHSRFVVRMGFELRPLFKRWAK